MMETWSLKPLHAEFQFWEIKQNVNFVLEQHIAILNVENNKTNGRGKSYIQKLSPKRTHFNVF